MVSSILLAAILAQAGGGSFDFEGLPAEARTTSSRAFVTVSENPTAQQFDEIRGEARLAVRDRIDVPGATYGDKADFVAEFRAGLTDYRIELISAGAPPQATPARQLPFRFGLEGGVRLADPVFGNTGVGLPRTTPARSAVAVFGLARITRNGLVVDEAAPVQIYALATGIHADDDTHRRLPAPRLQDTELIVYVPQIESDLVPNNYLLVTFEDVAIAVNGRALPAVAHVPTVADGAVVIPLVPELEDLPRLDRPAFAGFARDVPTRDNVPLDPIRPPNTPRPLNAADATPTPQAIQPLNAAIPAPSPVDPDTTPQPGNAAPATPLPETVNVLTGDAPPSLNPLIGPTPANASAATPLPEGVAPLTSAPAVTGPGLGVGMPPMDGSSPSGEPPPTQTPAPPAPAPTGTMTPPPASGLPNVMPAPPPTLIVPTVPAPVVP